MKRMINPTIAGATVFADPPYPSVSLPFEVRSRAVKTSGENAKFTLKRSPGRSDVIHTTLLSRFSEASGDTSFKSSGDQGFFKVITMRSTALLSYQPGVNENSTCESSLGYAILR